MDYQNTKAVQRYYNYVALKYQLYNSLFSSLPFQRIEKTGILLSVLLNDCEEGYANALNPTEIIENFFLKHTNLIDENDKLNLLFRFVQYVERQVVLFDALEDSAFTMVKDIAGVGSMKHLEQEVIRQNKEEEFVKKIEEFSVRIVLTAHPTQFYPGSVLGIIHDLSDALSNNDTKLINMYLQQLGKTPFLQKQKPTPFDEATSLIWYLENVFYTAIGKIVSNVKNQFPTSFENQHPLIQMGFWPGGDRDGNPFVTTDITIRVASALRAAIIKCYYREIRKIKRRLTFSGIDTILNDLEKKLYDNINIPGQITSISKESILQQLYEVKEILQQQHDGLFINLVNQFINKVIVFGLHFVSLDIRQERNVHTALLERIGKDEYTVLKEKERIHFIATIIDNPAAFEKNIPTDDDTIRCIQAMQLIQANNGEQGCNRYIISQCESALNVLELYSLFLLSGWHKENLTVDIVPLFEMIDDLANAAAIMQDLYSNEQYKQHLKQRNNRQTIMLGFSDGTKDGGYLMANYSIYKAKEALTKVSQEYGIDVLFFDGRGGPPARGGGKTHNFYASMGKNISNKEIQLTVQGQTVSSNFGIIDSAQYNLEQLINAGISNTLFADKTTTLLPHEEMIFQKLSEISFAAYKQLKNHPLFISYLLHISPVQFYSETNIASRPSKRNQGNQLQLKELRAIPFVGAWSQLKQNVTGYYGVGTALAAIEKEGNFSSAKELYKHSLFFKTLIDNCEMAMKKCFFPLTAWLKNDAQYGEIWTMIYDEFLLTQKYVLLLTDKPELMSDFPVDILSISMREKIVLPLLTIQQFAINCIRKMETENLDNTHKRTYEKLIIRSSFGIINAGRNSA